MSLKKRFTLWLVRVFGRLGLIKVPYSDYDAAQGNVGGSDDE